MSTQPTACSQIQSEYGHLMRQFGTPGQPFDGDDLESALRAFQAGSITEQEMDALEGAWQSGCRVPDGGAGVDGRLLLAGAAVVGAGWLALRGRE